MYKNIHLHFFNFFKEDGNIILRIFLQTELTTLHLTIIPNFIQLGLIQTNILKYIIQ